MLPYVFTTLEHTVGNPFLQYIVLLIHNKFLNSRVRNTRTRFFLNFIINQKIHISYNIHV